MTALWAGPDSVQGFPRPSNFLRTHFRQESTLRYLFLFGHPVMQADSFKKTLILGKNSEAGEEGDEKAEDEVSWIGITDLIEHEFEQTLEIVKDKEA